MTQPEYIVALLSIIVGLGLTDLAQSVRELVRPRRPTNWHWLPLLWAASTFLLAVQLWWNAFSSIKDATAQFFVPYLTSFLLLYLTCAFALLAALIPTDRWWVHAPVSVLCFLMIAWSTINSILGLA